MAKIGPLTPAQAARALANRFGTLADGVRQLQTKLGVRPYRVFLVYVAWSGASQGAGAPREASRVELLPTPKVDSLDKVALSIYGAGVVPMGSLRLTNISVVHYNADDLAGRSYPTRGVDRLPDNVEFFYDVVEDGRSGDQPVHSRFRPLSVPERDAGNVCWTIMVEKVSQDLGRDGLAKPGAGTEG